MEVVMPNCPLPQTCHYYYRPVTACRQQQLLPSRANEAAHPPARHLKVELCRNFLEQQFCQYGERCCFAHGYSELSGASLEKLRTKPCRLFHEQSACRFGNRCNFRHRTRELSEVVGQSRQSQRSNTLEWYPEILLFAGGSQSRLFK